MCAIITRALYIFNPFFTAIYIVEWSVLQTIYVLNKEILQFQGLKSMVYNQEWFQIKSRLFNAQTVDVYGFVKQTFNFFQTTTPYPNGPMKISAPYNAMLGKS